VQVIVHVNIVRADEEFGFEFLVGHVPMSADFGLRNTFRLRMMDSADSHGSAWDDAEAVPYFASLASILFVTPA
jgi:hypothetical protein